MKPTTAILLGAGARGNVYARYAKEHPDELVIVGVAEPNAERRHIFTQEHHISSDNVCESWEQLLSRPKMADACLVCTLDNMHTAPALRALELGYHVLLEKPMATTQEECEQITEAAIRSGRVLSVCHVLRYTPFYSRIKQIIEKGTLGDILSIQQTEGVGYWHQAHSFVRGNWADSNQASPMILQKCCHDLDILNWLLDERCTKISSFGSLTHFVPENAPAGAALRCLDGCPAATTCPYYAPRFYLEHPQAVTDGFVDVITTDPSRMGILHALQTGPYGRCVYHCGNDVVDHQVVCMEYANHATATLTMTAFTSHCNRTVRIMGSKGELYGDMEKNLIEVQDFLEDKPQKIQVQLPSTGPGYHHSGGDFYLIRDFVRAVQADCTAQNRTSAQQSLQGHCMCFAAERARLSNSVITL